MRRGDGAVDQQRLGRAADAGAPHLGVDGDRHRHVEFGRAVDIEMADAFEMREHRHARLLSARAPTRLLPPRGTITSRLPARPVSISPTAARSVVGTSWIASSGSPAAFSPSTRQAWMAAEEFERIRAAAQDHRIAGLEAERAGVGRDVRPALVDDADDAERRAHALDMQAVRPVPCGDHLADRVRAARRWRARRRPCRGCGPASASAGPSRPATSPASSPFAMSIALASRIACSLRRIASAMAASAAFLLLGARDGQRARGGAGLAADRGHQRCGILAGLFMRRQHGSSFRFLATSSRPLRRARLTTRSSRWTIAERAS